MAYAFPDADPDFSLAGTKMASAEVARKADCDTGRSGDAEDFAGVSR
jgi:hypothetical protein